MVSGQAYRQFGGIAQKWRALAERRCEYFAELYRTGRWKLYCIEEEQFALRMREVLSIAERWREIAPPPTDSGGERETPDVELYRTAA